MNVRSIMGAVGIAVWIGCFSTEGCRLAGSCSEVWKYFGCIQLLNKGFRRFLLRIVRGPANKGNGFLARGLR